MSCATCNLDGYLIAHSVGREGSTEKDKINLTFYLLEPPLFKLQDEKEESEKGQMRIGDEVVSPDSLPVLRRRQYNHHLRFEEAHDPRR